ncbi:MAG: hypothetical protein JSS75_00360 [Bacteroidetes bacterium]|nr:hypothetical protein [Bacteroidota bacterium]
MKHIYLMILLAAAGSVKAQGIHFQQRTLPVAVADTDRTIMIRFVAPSSQSTDDTLNIAALPVDAKPDVDFAFSPPASVVIAKANGAMEYSLPLTIKGKAKLNTKFMLVLRDNSGKAIDQELVELVDKNADLKESEYRASIGAITVGGALDFANKSVSVSSPYVEGTFYMPIVWKDVALPILGVSTSMGVDGWVVSTAGKVQTKSADSLQRDLLRDSYFVNVRHFDTTSGANSDVWYALPSTVSRSSTSSENNIALNLLEGLAKGVYLTFPHLGYRTYTSSSTANFVLLDSIDVFGKDTIVGRKRQLENRYTSRFSQIELGVGLLLDLSTADVACKITAVTGYCWQSGTDYIESTDFDGSLNNYSINFDPKSWFYQVRFRVMELKYGLKLGGEVYGNSLLSPSYYLYFGKEFPLDRIKDIIPF